MVLALVTLRAATDRVSDVDVGWIVAAGRSVLLEGAAPSRNGFSFVAPDQPWIMHEWLLGPLYALGFRALGPAFFAVVGVGASVVLGAIVLARASQLRHAIVAAPWAAALFVFAFDRVRSARPIGLSLVLACVLVVLAFVPRLRPRAVAACVVVELVWTNVHGSFPLGVVILAFACLDASERRGHFVALGAAALATLVNPYGLRLHELVARYALGLGDVTRAIHERVLEFSPVWRAGYHDVVGPVEVVLVLGIVALGADALRSSRARGAAALSIVLGVAALLQARNASLAILVGGLVLPRHLLSRVGHLLGPTREGDVAPRRVLMLVAPAALVGGVALAWTAATRDADDWIDPSMGGAPFARLARGLPDGAKVFVPFRSGGLLLLLASERGVMTFYDPRNDCYPASVVSAALALKDGELPAEGLGSLLARYGTEHAIVPLEAHVRATPGDPRWPALAVLEPALRDGFRPVATDGGWVRLERARTSGP